jgi:hypothetical protein
MRSFSLFYLMAKAYSNFNLRVSTIRETYLYALALATLKSFYASCASLEPSQPQPDRTSFDLRIRIPMVVGDDGLQVDGG